MRSNSLAPVAKAQVRNPFSVFNCWFSKFHRQTDSGLDAQVEYWEFAKMVLGEF